MAKKTTKKRTRVSAKQKEAAALGRPPHTFTVDQINQMKQLALNGCQNNTIATIIDIDYDTMMVHFKKDLTKQRAIRKNNLRKLQLQAARKLNPALLIFLGKNELEQADKQEVVHSGEVGLTGLLNALDGQSRGLPG